MILIELLLYVFGDILLNGMLLKCSYGNVNSFLLHVAEHIGALDDDFLGDGSGR